MSHRSSFLIAAAYYPFLTSLDETPGLLRLSSMNTHTHFHTVVLLLVLARASAFSAPGTGRFLSLAASSIHAGVNLRGTAAPFVAADSSTSADSFHHQRSRMTGVRGACVMCDVVS